MLEFFTSFAFFNLTHVLPERVGIWTYLIIDLAKTMNRALAAEVIAGIILYVIILNLHEPIIGIDPLIWFLPRL